ncbi:RNA-directed DNA polymerase, eukaryota, reverse transcriptase zinc-binding domain protein [Tanacetum coccineum]
MTALVDTTLVDSIGIVAPLQALGLLPLRSFDHELGHRRVMAHDFFKAGRGLRQGNLISPCLFTLVMEVLNLMIKRHVLAEKKFKYHWGCKELKITSLCFVDDLLMLCHGDLVSASILRRRLDDFCLSSSVLPSMSKSEAFFGNVSDSVKVDISLVMSFKEGVLPIKY